MLVYPDFSPSIRYIKDPKTITIFNTAKKNINIFLLLATNATIKRLASPIYLTNFNILNILSTLKILITDKTWVPGKNKLR